MTRRALSLLVLLGLLAGACVPVEAGPGDLDELVDRWQATSGVDAVVVAVGRPGEEPRVVTAAGGIGVTDIHRGNRETERSTWTHPGQQTAQSVREWPQ